MLSYLSTTLQAISHDVWYVLPELMLAGGMVILLMLGLINKNKQRASFQSKLLLTGLFIGGSLLIQFFVIDYTRSHALFSAMLNVNSFTQAFTCIVDVGVLLTLIMIFNNRDNIKTFQSEFFVLILSATLGAHLLIASTNFIMIFISLELLSISSYILAGFSYEKKSAEGSLKYFLFGSVASAMMVYGISLLYGITGSLDFTSEPFSTSFTHAPLLVTLTAGILTLAGYLYKIAAAPLHPWAPDVYEASPLPMVAFFSVVPKLAGLAALIKFTATLHASGSSAVNWQIILSAIAIITLTIGNFAALWQNNIKRLMAYSSIGQAGFLLVGLAAFTESGIQTMIFYAIIYTISTLAAFIIFQPFENRGMTTIESYSGIGRYFPFISILLIIVMAALAGLPPTAGFTGKLLLFSALWEAYTETNTTVLLWLLIFGLLNTVVSLFYYLKIPFYAFLRKGSHDFTRPTNHFQNFFILFLVLIVLLLFLRPDLLMGWTNRITFVF